jgi:signal transduction histidine kinase
LIDNAIKHAPAGTGVTVGIDAGAGGAGETSGAGGADLPRRSAQGAKAGRAGSPFVRLFVEDHGPGIPPGEQLRIFDPFYRRGDEIRRETRGIGIGLAIVRHVAEAHGGRVTVQSELGRGSRFTMELPGEVPSSE